jgi:glycosyltransferase involved in cell wall biosynthesis
MEEIKIIVEQFGRFIVARDAHSFADAVTGLLNDPTAAQELGRRARELVHSQWSAADYVDAHYQLYRRYAAQCLS